MKQATIITKVLKPAEYQGLDSKISDYFTENNIERVNSPVMIPFGELSGDYQVFHGDSMTILYMKNYINRDGADAKLSLNLASFNEEYLDKAKGELEKLIGGNLV